MNNHPPVTTISNAQPTWLLTFSDLLTLLLTFFVLRYAMVHNLPEQTKESLSSPIIAAARQTPEKTNTRDQQKDPLLTTLNETIFLGDNVDLSFSSAVRIKSLAKAAVERQAKSVLILVTAPTDNDHTWALASKRIQSVYRQFLDAGVERKTIALSFYAATKKENTVNYAASEEGKVQILVGGIL